MKFKILILSLCVASQGLACGKQFDVSPETINQFPVCCTIHPQPSGEHFVFTVFLWKVGNFKNMRDAGVVIGKDNDGSDFACNLMLNKSDIISDLYYIEFNVSKEQLKDSFIGISSVSEVVDGNKIHIAPYVHMIPLGALYDEFKNNQFDLYDDNWKEMVEKFLNQKFEYNIEVTSHTKKVIR